MKKLKQNNLEESTTDIGFVKAINENAEELGTNKIALIREVEIEDGVNVNVESITPHRMKAILNQQITASGGDSEITFKTPGEPVQVYVNGDEIGPVETQVLDGIVQLYNKNMDGSAITGINLSLVEDLREGEANVNANAVIGTLSFTGTSSDVIYSLDETGDYSSFIVESNNLKVNTTPLTSKTYNITIKATSGEDVESKNFEIEVLEAYPEITLFTISPESDLIQGNANVQADAIVATMSVEGGSNPITYSLREDASNGIDNSSFKVDGANLKVNTTPLVTKNYKVALRATDVHGKTKDQNAIIEVSAPEITTLTITPVNSLTAPIAADTVVANLSTQGGISPYTYSLKASTGDNAEFKIENDTVKNISSIDSEATKSITVIVTDANNKTKEQTAQITVNAVG